MRYIYCVKDNILNLCESAPLQQNLYYIFEYTKDLQLIVTECKDNICKEVDVNSLNLKFNWSEAPIVEEQLNKLTIFRNFLQKYNIKVYCIVNSSIQEAIVNPKLYYYKYLGLIDETLRKKSLDELKKWVSRFVVMVNVLESLKIVRFLSHLDSLDGRYALWVEENSQEPATSLITENAGEVKVWLGYKGCDVYLKNKIEKCFRINGIKD